MSSPSSGPPPVEGDASGSGGVRRSGPSDLGSDGGALGNLGRSLLLRLAQELTSAIDRESFVRALTSFLTDAFGCRSGVAFLTADGQSIWVHPGLVGYPADVWADQELPLDLDIPLCAAVRDGVLVEVGAPEGCDRFASAADTTEATGDLACACLPLADPSHEGRAVAVARLGWSEPHPLTEGERTLLGTAASIAGLSLARMELVERAARDQFRGALDAMIDQVGIGRAIRGRDGEILDFELVFLNAASIDGAGRTAEELMGGRARDLFPNWQAAGLFDRFREVVDSGEPFVGDRLPYDDRLPDGSVIRGHWSLQVVKLGDGYICASRDVTDLVRAEQAALEAERIAVREQIAGELLQRAALPSELPAIPDLDLGAAYRPAERGQPVGGDWYDAFELDDGCLAVVIADVAGHGQEAAVFMVQVRNVFRAVAIDHREPAEVLAKVNDVLCRLRGTASPFVTCCYGIVDPAARTFAWARAGHPPVAVVGADGQGRSLWGAPGLPLAVAPDATYGSEQVQLDPGDRLVLYTDGLIERRDEDLDVGVDRLVGLVGPFARRGAQALADDLAASVVEPDDDIAVLCVALAEVGAAAPAWRPWSDADHPDRAVFDVPDDPTGPGQARTFAAGMVGDRQVDHDALGLLTSEVVSNAVLHGQSPVTMRLAVEDDHLLVEVHDHASDLPETQPHDPTTPGGLGLYIVAAMSLEWGVESHPDGGKVVWFRIPADPAPTA